MKIFNNPKLSKQSLLTILLVISNIFAISASDICGKVVRAGSSNPGYDAMQRRRYVYYMTTEDIAGEHWATILVSAYPNTDPAIDVQIAGFYLRVLPGPTDNTNPVDGRDGEWGFLCEPTLTNYYDNAKKVIQINGASDADWDDLIKVEYIDVTYEGYSKPVKAIRIKFKYKNELAKFRFNYWSISNSCETGEKNIQSYEVNYNDGTGSSEFPYLSLDGSCRDIINAASPVLTVNGEDFNTATPANLTYNAVDESEAITGECGSLLAATTFSSKGTTATHFAADQIEWFDKTDEVKMKVFYPEAYSNGAFMDQEKGYAIVSNPKVLDGRLESRNDNVNRLIFNLPSYCKDAADSLVLFEIKGVKSGTTLTMYADWEYVSPDCWTCQCNTCDPIVKENSNIRGYSSFGDKNIDEFNRRARKGTIKIEGTVVNSQFYWAPSVRNSRDCDVIAFSNIRFFGCPKKYIDKDIETNADCEGTIVTLNARGIGGEDGYVWYERIDDGSFNVIPGETKRTLQVELDLRHHAYYATNGSEEVDPVELQGIVCCETNSTNFKTLWKEDFGTVKPGTIKPFPTSSTDQFRANIVKHNYAQPGQCCHDGWYRVTSSVKDANMVDPGYSASEVCNGWNMTPVGDHTGNENGGFLLINTGAEMNAQMLQLDVKGPFCANTWYNFSMWATQVSKKDEYPCSIVIEIYETPSLGGKTGELLGRVATGEMTVFEMERWVNYALSVQPKESTAALRIKVINEGKIGNGNDIAIDDIQFTTCSPDVALTTENGTDKITEECGDNTTLKITFNGKETTYFPEGAWFLWQNSTDNGATWTNLEEPKKAKTTFTTIANTMDPTVYRAIVANSAEVAKAVGAGTETSECEVYTITNYNQVTCSGGCDIPEAPITSGNTFCQGEDTKNVEITSAIPTGATVAWYDAPIYGTKLSSEATFKPSEAGTYYAEIIAAGGICKSVRTAATLTEAEVPVVSISGTLESCPNSIIIANAVVSKGTKPYEFEWSDYATGTDNPIKITLPDTPGTETITVKVTDSNGCIDQKSATIEAKDGLRPTDPEVTDNTFCTGTDIKPLTASANLSSTEKIEWFETETSDVVLATGPEYLPSEAGTYYATVRDTKTNCSSDRIEVTLTEVSPITSVKFTDEINKIQLGAQSDVNIEVEPSTAPYTDQWSVNGVVVDASTFFPHIPYVNQLYKVVVKDECANTFEIESTLDVVWPTIFTPHNADGYNDDFVVDMDQPFAITVFDRYGDKVYEGENGWPNDAAASKMPGVYYYVVTLPDGNIKKGSIEIFK